MVSGETSWQLRGVKGSIINAPLRHMINHIFGPNFKPETSPNAPFSSKLWPQKCFSIESPKSVGNGATEQSDVRQVRARFHTFVFVLPPDDAGETLWYV